MTCPICKAETAREFRPFCSGRCADLDLARWFTGAYAIASEEPVDEDMDPPPSEADEARHRH